MNLDSIRAFCLSLPHATEKVQWGDDLVFKVGGKMFAVLVLEPSPHHRVRMSFKCTPEKFAELTEREGIIPAPYSARYSWVATEAFDTIASAELKPLLRESYQMVFEKLPKKTKAALQKPPSAKTSKRKAKKR